MYKRQALYSASKAYLRSFSVAFAKEVREHGIRVTAVCPAGVATDLYGLTPRWQRIGTRLGVLITADSCEMCIRDRRRGECADCSMFRYCQGGGMHLRGDDGELLYCHYHRL